MDRFKSSIERETQQGTEQDPNKQGSFPVTKEAIRIGILMLPAYALGLLLISGIIHGTLALLCYIVASASCIYTVFQLAYFFVKPARKVLNRLPLWLIPVSLRAIQ